MTTFLNLAAYKFVSLGDLKSLQSELREITTKSGMRGTILLSPEGINFSVVAEPQAAHSFLVRLRHLPALADLTPKVTRSEHQPFNRMLVKIKKEIISFGINGIAPATSPAPAPRPARVAEMVRRRPRFSPPRCPQ